MPSKAKDYQRLSVELESVLAKLQSSDIQVDEAVKLYEQGLQLIEALERHLSSAENTIETLKVAAMKRAAE